MTTMKQTTRLLLVSGFTLLFAACAGEEHLPIALEPVVPEGEEASLKVQSRAPMTLLEAVLKQGVPAKVAKEALFKYDKFVDHVKKPAFITMVDFSQHSSKKRMYIVNRKTGDVDAIPVAHGAGSDPDNDGIPQFFSNVPNSHMSSLGAYLVAEEYKGKYGASLRLDGLERTNSNVRNRAIVLHPADYVKEGQKKQGRSWGCPAVPYAWIEKIIERTADGAFLYAYGINKRKASINDDGLIQQWNLIPVDQWVDESEEAPLAGE